MCGRFAVFTEKEMMAYRFKHELPADYIERYNVAPTQNSLAIRHHSNTMEWLSWGFKLQSLVINARIETIKEKVSFKGLLDKQRCLIPMTAYYEWEDGTGQPFLLHKPDYEPFALGGFWQKEVSVHNTIGYVIATDQANAHLNHLHARMPLFIPQNLENDWLNNYAYDELINEITAYNRTVRLLMHPVANLVNKVKVDHKGLLRPIAPQMKMFE